MLCAVTGGTGFIGSVLVARLLERGDRVRMLSRGSSPVPSHENLEVVRGDLHDGAALRRLCAGADVLFHLAAHVSFWRGSREEQERTNVEGTRFVMDAARLAGVRRVIYTSSVAAIGIPQKNPADETNPFSGWQYEYFRSKYLAECAAFDAVEQHGLDVVALNPGTVYGGALGKRVTGSQKIIGMVDRGIAAYPPGAYCACDVDDVVAAHLAAVEKGRSGERYILGGHNVELRDVFGEIARQLGRPEPWIRIPEPLLLVVGAFNDLVSRFTGRSPTVTWDYAMLATMHLAYDSRKAMRELGYTVTPFPQMIAKGIRSYRARQAQEARR